MFKSILILISILILNSCYSENIVGKKILCVRSDISQHGFDDVRSYEFISDSELIRTFMWFDEPLDSFYNDFKGKKWEYKLTSNSIEVFSLIPNCVSICLKIRLSCTKNHHFYTYT